MEEIETGWGDTGGGAVEAKPENPPAFARTAYAGIDEPNTPYLHHEQDGMTLREQSVCSEISVNEDSLQGMIVDELLKYGTKRDLKCAIRIIDRIRPYLRTTELVSGKREQMACPAGCDDGMDWSSGEAKTCDECEGSGTFYVTKSDQPDESSCPKALDKLAKHLKDFTWQEVNEDGDVGTRSFNEELRWNDDSLDGPDARYYELANYALKHLPRLKRESSVAIKALRAIAANPYAQSEDVNCAKQALSKIENEASDA